MGRSLPFSNVGCEPQDVESGGRLPHVHADAHCAACIVVSSAGRPMSFCPWTLSIPLQKSYSPERWDWASLSLLLSEARTPPRPQSPNSITNCVEDKWAIVWWWWWWWWFTTLLGNIKICVDFSLCLCLLRIWSLPLPQSLEPSLFLDHPHEHLSVSK